MSRSGLMRNYIRTRRSSNGEAKVNAMSIKLTGSLTEIAQRNYSNSSVLGQAASLEGVWAVLALGFGMVLMYSAQLIS